MQALFEEVARLPFSAEEVKKEYLALCDTKNVLIETNKTHHLCVYTLPYHKDSQRVLMGHHIKADKWLVPGGHIDKDETIKQTAVREIAEEMELYLTIEEMSEPFFAEITNITNSKPPRYCQKHYSIWIYFSSPSTDIVLDPGEFYESSWLTLDEGIEKTTDPANKEALEKFKKIAL